MKTDIFTIHKQKIQGILLNLCSLVKVMGRNVTECIQVQGYRYKACHEDPDQTVEVSTGMDPCCKQDVIFSVAVLALKRSTCCIQITACIILELFFFFFPGNGI